MKIKLFLPTIIIILITGSASAQNFLSKPGRINLFGREYIGRTQSGQSSGLYRSWIANYGSGDAPSYQMANKIKTDSQGNVIVAGSVSDSSYGADLFVRKFDKNGNQLWYKKYKGTVHGDNTTIGLAIDGNDNIYVLGRVFSAQTWYDIVTIKYSPDGTELWSKSYDGTLHGNDYPSAIKIDKNNDVYVTGWVADADNTYDLVNLKYDSQGNQLWDYLYTGGKNGWVYGHDLALDNSGNVYDAAAIYDTNNNYDLALIKLDQNGKLSWVARFDSAGNSEEGLQVDIASGSNIIVGGDAFIGSKYYYLTVSFDSSGNQNWVKYRHAAYNPVAPQLSKPVMTFDNSGNTYITGEDSVWEMLTYKINSGGSTVWEKAFEPATGHPAYPNATTTDNSSDILIAGYGYEPDSSGTYQPQASVLEYDSAGSLLWNSQPKGIGNAFDISADKNGNSYATGFVRSISAIFYNQGALAGFEAAGKQLWSKSYAGKYGSMDEPDAMTVDINGNILITAKSYNKHGSYDFLTLKYDDNGNNVWVRSYENSADTSYIPVSIAADKSGNIFVTGYKQFTANNLNYIDMLTVEYDPGGNLMWSRAYHDQDQNMPVSIKIDNNDNVIVLGYWQNNKGFTHHIILVKYSSSGQLLWGKDVNQDVIQPVGLQVDANGNSYIASQSAVTHQDSSTNLDYNLLKFNPTGMLLWSKTFNDSLNLQDYITGLILGKDNSVYVTGYIDTYTKQTSLTMKYDTSGQILWSAFYDSLGTAVGENQGNHAKALGEDAAGNIYVTGYFNNGVNDTEIFLLKYDKNGKLQHVSVYNCPDKSEADDYVEKILVMSDGTVYLPGHFYQYFPDYSLETIKFLPDGSLDGVGKYQLLTSPAEVAMTPAGIAALPSGNIVEVASDVGYKPYWNAISIIDYSGSTTGININNNYTIPAQYKLSQNFPNPFNPSTKINFSIPQNSNVKIEIYNILGQRVRTLLNESKSAGNYTITFNAENLTSGVYLYRIQAGNFTQVKKMILMK